MSEKVITGKLVGDKVVIEFNKELLLNLFEEFQGKHYKIKNNKMFLQAVPEYIIEQIDNDVMFFENIMDEIVGIMPDFIKEIDGGKYGL